jgi:hypothetical protein
MHALTLQQQKQQQHTTLAKKILWTENFKNHEETYMYSCARARLRASPFAIAKNTKKRWKILASINRSLGKKKEFFFYFKNRHE